MNKFLRKILGTSNERMVGKFAARVTQINALESQMQAISDDGLKAKTLEFKERLKKGATLDSLLVEAFAVCREAGRRSMNMRHYDVQLIGGMVLHTGQIAEMKTQVERGPKQVKAAILQVEASRNALQTCKDATKKKKMDADRKQLQLREREAKIHDWEGKMNAAKNNREFQAIKEQIAADSQANNVLSDEILEILEEITGTGFRRHRHRAPACHGRHAASLSIASAKATTRLSLIHI